MMMKYKTSSVNSADGFFKDKLLVSICMCSPLINGNRPPGSGENRIGRGKGSGEGTSKKGAMEMKRRRTDVVEMLRDDKLIRVCAPMVRYSKLTVQEYGADLCYTPMIMADSFVRSAVARDLEYQQCAQAGPTIVQFAANNAHDFAAAVQLTAPWTDGVDLNCGCPQRWACDAGLGASLLGRPALVADMIRQATMRSDRVPVSVKIRVEEDARQSVELARQLEAAGVAWLTVHGRTRRQRPGDVPNYALIALIKDAVNIPVIANGGVDSFEAVHTVAALTGADGVMAARALLENPALFAGHPQTPWRCLERFVQHSLDYGTSSAIFHHHLAKMTGALLSPTHSRHLNALSNASVPTLLEFIDGIKPLYS